MGKLTTKYLRADDANNLLEALRFSDEQGHPLNLAITAHWLLFNGRLSGEQRLANAQERLRHSFNRRGHDLYWYWVRERSGDTDHTHLHAHDPFNDDGITFEHLLLRALAPDGEAADYAVLVKPTGSGQRGSGGPLGWWRYLAKGLHPVEAISHHVKPRRQGDITGKRCGMTENLNRAARMRALNTRPTQGA
jgi:hypothetical protein